MSLPTATPPLPSATEMEALRSTIGADLPRYLADLEHLVNIDCGSYTPEGVDEVGRWVAAFCLELGASVETRASASLQAAKFEPEFFQRCREASRGSFARPATRCLLHAQMQLAL